MIKKHKVLMVITSLIILIPIVVGIVLWDKLPEQLPTHWGVNGQPDNYTSKFVAVYGMPALLLLIHWACIFFTSLDPKNKDIDKKPLMLVFWICPVVSILAVTMVYSVSMGVGLDVNTICIIFLGVIFIVIGNYLPKCRQNYTIGIKLPWTLDDEENWNKTHRFGGIVMTAGGFVLLLLAAFKSIPLAVAVVFIIAIIPGVYSYLIYRKKNHL